MSVCHIRLYLPVSVCQTRLYVPVSMSHNAVPTSASMSQMTVPTSVSMPYKDVPTSISMSHKRVPASVSMAQNAVPTCNRTLALHPAAYRRRHKQHRSLVSVQYGRRQASWRLKRVSARFMVSPDCGRRLNNTVDGGRTGKLTVVDVPPGIQQTSVEIGPPPSVGRQTLPLSAVTSYAVLMNCMEYS